jgi:hypothetical protein
MSVTPLEKTLGWFAERDEMGGFQMAAAMLFPGWTLRRSCRAPHREDKAASFSLYRNKRGDWRFKDFGTGEQGGLVGFVMLAGMNEKQASHWLMEKAGVNAARSPFSFIHHRKTEAAPPVLERPPDITAEAAQAFSEGVDYLLGCERRVERLAEFRSWPLAWAQRLAARGTVSMPLYHHERTMAFKVEAPEAGPAGLVMREVGFHCRLQPKRDERRAGWRFVPNEREHGQSTPALPFILHGSAFDSAKLLVITGGQWDALTFAFAAGWLGEKSQWPAGVCVLGIRGDASANIFLRHYARFWPRSANCLLLPDADASGCRWHEGGNSFADQLAARCRRVAIVKCAQHKDFNDLYRAEKITPEQIGELLESRGVAVEGGMEL